MARSFHQYSPQAQVMVCAVLSIGVLGAAWRALIEPERIELAARRAHLAVVQAGVHNATATAQRLPAVQTEIASLEAALRQITTAPVDADDDEKALHGVLRGLHGLASESSLNINSFTPKSGAEREQYFEWPIELTLEGGYHDLARFFDRVASEPRLISFSNLQFRASTTASGPRRGSVQATSVALTFLFPPIVSPIEAPLEGVDMPPSGGYDDGGRRDPFASLVVEKAITPAAAAESAGARPVGLVGVAVMDVAVRGIISSGQTWLAILAGPDGAMYLAHSSDRLHDGVVRRIDRDGVVFLARVPEGPGRIVSREVRKVLRPTSGEGR